MPKKDLPRFVIYQPNPQDYHICLEVGNKFFCWLSNYVPSLDVRFPREIKRIKDITTNKIPTKQVFDRGTYTVTKSDTKALAEKKLTDGIKKKSFAFILNGKKLHGRFSFKQTPSGMVIQKYKDKYAIEEDVLSGDLSRTISTMIPDYDEKKIKLNTPQKRRTGQKQQEEEPLPDDIEEITPDKVIGNREYHFAFYTSDNEPDLCLITAANGNVVILQKDGNVWELLRPLDKPALRRKKEFIEHAAALWEII
jgi:hypothetical protein